MNNTRTVNYQEQADIFWQMMSDDEKVDYYIDLVLDGKANKQDIEYLLRHKKKLLARFKKNTKGM